MQKKNQPQKQEETIKSQWRHNDEKTDHGTFLDPLNGLILKIIKIEAKLKKNLIKKDFYKPVYLLVRSALLLKKTELIGERRDSN